MTAEKPKFTPGPWKTFTYDVTIANDMVEGRDGDFVADCTMSLRTDDENNANARLISAAPELYEAVIGAYEILCDFTDEDWKNRDFNVVKKCLAAIRKANGEEQ